MGSLKIKRTVKICGFYTIVGLLLTWLLSPFLWTLITSLQPYECLVSVPPRLELNRLNLEYYRILFSDEQFLTALKNSTIVILTATSISMLLTALGGYAVGTFRVRGLSAIMFALLSIQLAPALALLIPLFVLFKTLNLIDTYAGLVIVFLVFQVPVGIWILRGFFESIPYELYDAARIDGCSRLGAFFRVALPLARPGILTVGIYTFITGWNDLLIPLTMSVYKTTMLTVYASSFGGLYQIDYGGATAVAVLSAIPTILLALIFRKNLVQGLTAGSIKG